MNDAAPTPRHIRCGDVVRHRPTGEEWLVAYADYESGDIAWAGWPPGTAQISDCDLVRPCDDASHIKSVRAWIEPWSGGSRRGAHIVRRLYPEAVAEAERLICALEAAP